MNRMPPDCSSATIRPEATVPSANQARGPLGSTGAGSSRIARTRSSGIRTASRSPDPGVSGTDGSSRATSTPIDATSPPRRSPLTSSITSPSFASGMSPSGASRRAARSSIAIATSPVQRFRQSSRPPEIRGSPGSRCPSAVTSSPGMGIGWWFGCRSITARTSGSSWSRRSGTGVPATDRSAMSRSSSVTNQPHREVAPERSMTRSRSGTTVHSRVGDWAVAEADAAIRTAAPRPASVRRPSSRRNRDPPRDRVDPSCSGRKAVRRGCGMVS